MVDPMATQVRGLVHVKALRDLTPTGNAIFTQWLPPSAVPKTYPYPCDVLPIARHLVADTHAAAVSNPGCESKSGSHGTTVWLHVTPPFAVASTTGSAVA